MTKNAPLVDEAFSLYNMIVLLSQMRRSGQIIVY